MITELIANQSLSRDALYRQQQQDIKNIIAFAIDHTDYYHDKFKGIQDYSLAHLPILTKDEIRNNLNAMLVYGKQAQLGFTGGSTGTPLPFWYDDAKHKLMREGMTRSYMLSGWQPGQKIINFWGATRDIGAGGVFDDNPQNQERTLPAQEFNETKLYEWVTFIQSYKPVLLQGYASVLTALSEFIISNNHNMPETLLGIYSTAEMLSDDARYKMKQAFNCKVFNQYGSREIPNIACECQHGNMHVFTDIVALESLDGRLIVTSLTNKLMPMIRYDIGDFGQLKDGDCSCGLPFPLMEVGLCRNNDFIRTPDGRNIHPSYFNRLLSNATNINEFQVKQSTPNDLILTLVASKSLNAEDTKSLQKTIKRDLNLSLEVMNVISIARTASGKHRFVIGLPP